MFYLTRNKFFLVLLMFFCVALEDSAPETTRFFRKLEELRWVSYSPTNMNPQQGIWPTEDSIRQDLQTLRNYGFQGVATYSAYETLAQIPRIAREVGLQGVIMGLWSFPQVDPVVGPIEWNNALQAKAYVDAYCVGNEGILSGRYGFAEVSQAVNSLRSLTQKPVTTNEELSIYFSTPGLVDLGDWIYPNIHPYWAGMREPQPAVQWTVQKFNLLQQRAPARFIVCKELGLPTAGAPDCSEARQSEYYYRLCGTGVRFHFFEAFDQPWKTTQPVEPYWGLFRSNRAPKQFVQREQVILTYVPPIGSLRNVEGKCLNVDRAIYGVTAFIFIPPHRWWVRPSLAQCVVDIRPDNTWTLDVTTGKIDEGVIKIDIFVVPKDFDCYSSRPTDELTGTKPPAKAAWSVERIAIMPKAKPTPVSKPQI